MIFKKYPPLKSGPPILRTAGRYFAQLESASSSQYRLDTDFNPAGSFEISMDFMVTNTITEQWLYGRWNTSNTSIGVSIRVKSGSVDFFVSESGSNSESISIPIVGANDWHSLTVVFLSGNTLIIALDGNVKSAPTAFDSVFISSHAGYIGSKGGSQKFIDGMIKNPKFKDIENSSNNQSYNLGLSTGDLESSVEGGDTITYLNISDAKRELYQFDNVDTWNNISNAKGELYQFDNVDTLNNITPPVQLLPSSIMVSATSGEDSDIILLIGQSNMVGRYGPIDPVLDATDPSIKMYGVNLQTVAIAADPLDHFDAGANTVGLGLTLAKNYNSPTGRDVLLIPSAKGGTGFKDYFWVLGGVGYNMAITRAYEATLMGSGKNKISMIAWHQGEDEQSWTEAQYAAKLDILINSMRSTIPTADNAPFIVGEINPSSNAYGAGVAAALLDTPNRHAKAGYVSTSDLALGGDNLHFTAASCRTMGERYNAVYENL